MEDGRVSLAEIFEVRASGFNSAELLAILSGAAETLIAKKTGIKGLFSPETLFVTEDGRIEIEICDTINPDFIPPETLKHPKEPLFDHHLVWCLGKIAQSISLPTSNDAGLFSLINLMTVEDIGTRPSMQKLSQMVRNKLANPDAVKKTLRLMFEEVMGNIEELADESDEEGFMNPPEIIPMNFSKKAQLTQQSSPSSSMASDSSNERSPSPVEHSTRVIPEPRTSQPQPSERHVTSNHQNNQNEVIELEKEPVISTRAVEESVTNVFKYGGNGSTNPFDEVDDHAFSYADDDEQGDWVKVRQPELARSHPNETTEIKKIPVNSRTSETLSRISEESAAISIKDRNSLEQRRSREILDVEVDKPEVAVQPAVRTENTGRFLKKSEIQNKYIHHKPSGSVEIVAAEVHKDYSRDSSPSGSFASEESSGERFERQDENRTPPTAIPNNDLNDRTSIRPESPQVNQNLIRHNSLKPSKIHRQSTNRKVKTIAVPEFMEKKPYPIIRLRAQSQKRRRVALHRVEETILLVKLLTGQTVELNCRSDALVGNIFDTVVAHLNLNESSFFGLAILENNEYFFLENEQRLEKFAPSGWRLALKNGARQSFMLFLRFKFYPKRIDFVKTQQARHSLYIQLRQNILDGALQVTRNQLLESSALALQAEFGDKHEHVSNYFALDGYVPKNMLVRLKSEESHNLKDALIHIHDSKKGLKSIEAEADFIEFCQTLPTFGAHFYLVHKFKPSSKNPVDARFRAHQWVVIMPQGIGIAKETQIGTKQINSIHEWHMIRTLQYDGKRFLLATMENNIAVDHVFYLEHFTKSRYLVKFAAEQHKFMLRMRQWQSTLQRNKLNAGKDVIVERDERDHSVPREVREHPKEERKEWNDLTVWTDQFIQETYGSDAQKLEITLDKDPNNGLGLTLVDGSVNGVKGVYVKSVAEHGDGRRKGLHMGDCILSINGVSLWNRTRHDAVTLVKQCENYVRIEFLRFHSITAVLLAEGPEKFKSQEHKTSNGSGITLSPKKSTEERSATLGRMTRTPPPERKETKVNRRQRAVSDFGAISDTMPTLNSEDLLKSMEQLSRSKKQIEDSSDSDEEETSFLNKGVYNPPVSDMYAFHRNSDEEDNEKITQPSTSKNKNNFNGYAQQRKPFQSDIYKKDSTSSLPKQKTLDWTNEVQTHEGDENSDDNDGQIITVELRRAPARSLGFRIASANGIVRIKQITSEPATLADLRENDRLLSINGKDLTGLAHQDVVNLLRNGGTVITLKVERTENEDEGGQSIAVVFEKSRGEDLGISLAKRSSSDGVYIRSLTLGSMAEEEGSLRIGDTILAINGVQVSQKSPKEIIELIREIDGKVRVTVKRS
uniref:ULP_PROTEASE domain-containing protein n=1 Tax=Bursaphelenchus xylophilus TaxID=6326 RepID=A0A1I7RLI5_BURXY